MSLKAVIIGCGAIGAQLDAHISEDDRILTHAHACVAHPEVELVAGIDPDEKNRNRFTETWGVPGHRTLDSVAGPVDLVCVATPAETHSDVVDSAIDLDVLAILCEKPLATDISEAERIVDESNRADIPLAVNYIRRYTPELATLRGQLEDGEFGDLETAVFTFTKGLFENGSHMVDLARWFFGDVDSVSVSHTESGIAATLTCPSGVCQLVGTGSWGYSHARADIYAADGVIRLPDGGTEIRYFRPESDPIYPGFVHLREQCRRRTDLHRATYHSLDNLVRALTGDGALICSGHEALKTHRVCENIAIS